MRARAGLLKLVSEVMHGLEHQYKPSQAGTSTMATSVGNSVHEHTTTPASSDQPLHTRFVPIIVTTEPTHATTTSAHANSGRLSATSPITIGPS